MKKRNKKTKNGKPLSIEARMSTASTTKKKNKKNKQEKFNWHFFFPFHFPTKKKK